MIPARLGNGRWRELGQDKRALASDPAHYDERDLAVRRAFDWFHEQSGGRAA